MFPYIIMSIHIFFISIRLIVLKLLNISYEKKIEKIIHEQELNIKHNI